MKKEIDALIPASEPLIPPTPLQTIYVCKQEETTSVLQNLKYIFYILSVVLSFSLSNKCKIYTTVTAHNQQQSLVLFFLRRKIKNKVVAGRLSL
jgi:hypothetical protein